MSIKKYEKGLELVGNSDIPTWVEFYTGIKDIAKECVVNNTVVFYKAHIIAVARTKLFNEFPYFHIVDEQNVVSVMIREQQEAFLRYIMEDLQGKYNQIGLVLKTRIIENCPYCYNEVSINNKFCKQSCSNCNEIIKPCSICILKAEGIPDCCKYCPLEKEA